VLKGFVMAPNLMLLTRHNRLDSEKFLTKEVHYKVMCAGGCGIAFSGKAQAGGVVEDEIIHMGWLDNCTMVRMFACTDCAANAPSIQSTLLLPRAVEVFTRLPGTAPREICFLSKAGGVYKNEEIVELWVESLDEIGRAIPNSNRVDWENFVRRLYA
jgi:hypothetical protein